MSLFGRSNTDEQSVLLCTIQSGAVYATLVLLQPRGKPFIVGSVTKPIAFFEHIEFDRFASATLQSLADACQEIVKNSISHVASRRIRKGHIDAVYVTYGSPWYVSQTRHIDVEKPENVTVTRELLDELLRTHVRGDVALLHDTQDARRVLQRDIVDIRLNGYSVDDPYGKQAKRIACSVVTGEISESFSKYTEDVIGRFFSSRGMYHLAAPTTIFSGIRDTLASDAAFLLIDVSAEMTDVSLVRDSVLLETVTFPSGVRTSMRLFAQKAKVLQNEVLGIMQGVRDKKFDATKAHLYESAAIATTAAWQEAFSRALVPLLEHAALPGSAFLLGDSGEFIRVKDLLLPTVLTHPTSGETLTTTLLLAESFSSFCVIREGVRLGHPLVPLSASYVHRLLTAQKGKTVYHK